MLVFVNRRKKELTKQKQWAEWTITSIWLFAGHHPRVAQIVFLISFNPSDMYFGIYTQGS